MKKLIVMLLCAVIVLTLVACGGKSVIDSKTDEQKMGEQNFGGAQIANPFVDCKTLEEAQTLVGFDISLPDNMPTMYSISAIRAVKDTMIEIIYRNGNDEIRIRKGTGSQDISGAYNEFSETGTIAVGNLQVMMKGSGGNVNVASWLNGDYAFSMTINLDGIGLNKSVVSDMVSGTK